VKRSIISFLAIAATFALSACGTGMNSQTAEMVAPVAGISLDAVGKDGQGLLQVRNAALVYPGQQGYKAGSEATARAWLFNSTPVEQLLVIKHQDQEIQRYTIPPGGAQKAEFKIKIAQDLSNASWVPVKFEWVNVKAQDAQLPIAPPEAPQPGVKIELPAEHE
jgi:hypothetical protein